MVFLSSVSTTVGILLCGVWLMLAPQFLHLDPAALRLSDVVCGALLVGLGLASLRFKTLWLQWIEAAIGVWLLMAPLVFWSRTPAGYINDTLIGTAVLVFSLLIPFGRATGGDEIPPGWSYNPSAWHQRVPIVVIGFVAFGIAAYMACYQLEYFIRVWDPVFGDGTHRVLTSDVSKAFPVSDAGLGAVTYLIEAMSGLVGDPRRWRAMPWTVLLFGFLVIPAGVVSIVLVILQPWSVGAWCFLCLVSALLCVITIPPAIDEVVACVEFLWRRKREGFSLWRSFFFGEVIPAPVAARQPSAKPSFSLELETPWNLLLTTLLGLWVLRMPYTYSVTGGLANVHYVVGALIVTFAVMSMAEAGRSARWFNVPLGAALLIAPWVLRRSGSGVWVDAAVGLAVIGLSIRRGQIKERFGAWSRYIV